MDMPASPGESTQCRKISGILNIVGDKWTVMIVRVLIERPRRFNDIKRTIGGISQQMLTRTLKALERDGMVSRTVYPTVPPQVEYALTGLGHSLALSLHALGTWAGEHLDEIEGNRLRYDADKNIDIKGPLPIREALVQPDVALPSHDDPRPATATVKRSPPERENAGRDREV